jgi:hypothetical protein
MAKRRKQRKREKQQRHAPRPVAMPTAHAQLDSPAERLVYSREQAAQALDISLATLDRRVVPVIATVKTEWGARLIPAAELERYLAERTEQPRVPQRRPARSGRRSTLPAEVVARIRHKHAHGDSLADIARRLNRDGIPTAQCGRQWWPSTVRGIVAAGARRNEAAPSTSSPVVAPPSLVVPE